MTSWENCKWCHFGAKVWSEAGAGWDTADHQSSCEIPQPAPLWSGFFTFLHKWFHLCQWNTKTPRIFTSLCTTQDFFSALQQRMVKTTSSAFCKTPVLTIFPVTWLLFPFCSRKIMQHHRALLNPVKFWSKKLWFRFLWAAIDSVTKTEISFGRN